MTFAFSIPRRLPEQARQPERKGFHVQIASGGADFIIARSLKAVQPDETVRKTLEMYQPGKGRTLLVSMAHGESRVGRSAGGIVITKYGHVIGDIPGVDCREAGHP